MKKKLFFLPLLTAFALASCTNDDDPATDGNQNGDGDYGYVAVNIVQPASTSRADASQGFEYGSKEENEAKTGLFFIFKADGRSMYGLPQRLALTGEGTSNTPEVERIYSAVLVVDGAPEEDKPNDGMQIVCVLNAPTELEKDVTTLDDLTAKIDDYSAHNPGEFIMSNSVYKNDNTKVLGAIVSGNVYKSASEALANPVDIYVERIVAKIRTKGSDTFKNNGAEPAIDGEKKSLTIKLTGIEIANIAEQSYLFKNVDGITYPWAWDVPNERSYWETVPSTLTYANKSYNEIVNDSPMDGENGTFDITKVDLTDYIQPNTNQNQKTSVLVTAELLLDGAPCEFVFLRGGYFTPDKALALIAQYVATNGYYKRTSADGAAETVYSQLSTTDFEWVNNKDLEAEDPESTITYLKRYEVIARVKSDVTNLYKREGDKYTALANADKINELLAGSEADHPYVAQYYKDGKCYYFVEIDQSSIAKADAHTYDGVVRNHIYNLTLNSIENVGTAVFDPTDVIIPERPDNGNLNYLAAQINVLAWKVVSQTVDF